MAFDEQEKEKMNTSSDLKYWPIFSLLEPDFVAEIHMVAVFGNLGNEALIVMKDKIVYALGSNMSCCLGTGDPHGSLTPRKVDSLCNKDIKTFAYGSGPHVLALTENGEVYSWGHNGYCEVGDGTCDQYPTPCMVDMPGIINLKSIKKSIVDIACGSHHSLALNEDGEVFAWGQNNCGQVSNGLSTNQATPRKVTSTLVGKKVVSIACGQTSSIAVTEKGEVYSWGYNGVGQLGIGNYVNQVNPCRVGTLVGFVIVKIVCGYAHALALSDEGKLYVWGGNSYGQLGINSKTNNCSPVSLPSEIVEDMGRISDIAALHYCHISVAIGKSGRVYMWGHCRGQSVTTPTRTPFTSIHDALACFATPSVMHKPLILHTNKQLSILECMASAFDDPSTSDLMIQVEGQPIHVHKAILKIRCSYFRTMFQNNWSENNQNIIEHDQFSYAVYKAFLNYLYTGTVDLPMEKVLELLDLANVYCENDLKKYCINMVKQGVTVGNVALLYNTAIEYSSKELEEFCFKFILNHMTAVTQTENFVKMDDSTIKTFIVNASKAGAFKT